MNDDELIKLHIKFIKEHAQWCSKWTQKNVPRSASRADMLAILSNGLGKSVGNFCTEFGGEIIRVSDLKHSVWAALTNTIETRKIEG